MNEKIKKKLPITHFKKKNILIKDQLKELHEKLENEINNFTF